MSTTVHEIDDVAVGCPYCGETDGEPITTYSREWQGDAYHGGMVEWQEEMCTKCVRAAVEHQMELAAEGF